MKPIIEYRSLVLFPFESEAETDSLVAFFINLIKLNSSSPSANQANLPCEKKEKSFLPDLATTEDCL